MPFILLAEDDESIRSIINCVLTADGHQVYCAVDGYDAVDQLLKLHLEFDLLVTDYNMPGMNGREVAFAAQMLCPELPVIMMSGHFLPEHSQVGNNCLVTALIEKPFSIRKLNDLIREVLAEAEEARHGVSLNCSKIPVGF